MVPAALAAFSAPIGVSVVPRALASSAETAWAEIAEKAIRPANQLSLRFMGDSSEGGLEGQADGAAVTQERRQSVRRGHGGAVVAVVTEKVDVLQVEAVLLLHVGAEADAVVAEALVAAEGRRGVAAQADRVGHRRRQVDTRQDLEPGGVERGADADVVAGRAAVPLVLAVAGCIADAVEQVRAAVDADKVRP